MSGAPTIDWVRPGVGFTPEAAASFRRAEAHAGRELDANSTYRDWDTQQAMHDAWEAYVAGTGPYPGHSRALPPEESMHCLGLAWDSDEWVRPGMVELLAEHGWVRTAAWDPTEQHHFEYQQHNDQHREDDMFTDEDRAKLNELYEDYARSRKGRKSSDGLAYRMIKRVDEAIRNGKAGSHTDGTVTTIIKKGLGQ